MEGNGQGLAATRERLAAVPGRRRIDLILDAPDPVALVGSLPAEEIYFTIQEVGLADAVELVQLASPDQFRAFLDLGGWKGDQLEISRVLPWLRAGRAGALGDDEVTERWQKKLAALDPEVLNLILRESIRIHDLEADPDPEIQSDRFMRTPEGRYVVEFLVEGTEYLAVRGLIDDLQAEDPFRATRVLAAIRWELVSELTESAYRWRAARLADLGFPPLEEALSWFAAPPRTRPAREAPPGVPERAPGLSRLEPGSLLERAAALLPGQERALFEAQLVAAANAVLVADGVDVGDLEAVQGAVEAARAYLTMGLEARAGQDPEAASRALAQSPLKRIFQQGFGRVLELKWRADRLFKDGRAGTPREPKLPPPLGEALAALARKRPLFFPGLLMPREEWGSPASAAHEPRHFRSTEELARAAEAVALAEEKLGGD
jgi:hypothetical protein